MCTRESRIAADLPSGTVTFLFTDIEGSTRLWQHSAEAMSEALKRHDALMRTAIEASGGHVFKTVGDAFCAAFHSPLDGLKAAVDAQLAVAAEPWSEDTPIRVRMSLHAGIAEQRDGDYFGPTLNRCARIESVGHGGQTLVSHAVYSLLHDEVPDGVSLRDLGEHRLRDLDVAERIYQLQHDDLQAEHPPLKSLDNMPNNLPNRGSRFIGREAELKEALSRLESTRLLTLTGPGGTGKTRLALQVAAEVLDLFPKGVWFIDLSPLEDGSLIAQTAASVLGLREMPGQNLEETLIAHLQEDQTLLIFDNCEHLIEDAARLVQHLLESGPDTRIIATSREVLNIDGEDSWPVPIMSVPDPKDAEGISIERLMGYESVQLFVDRAIVAKSGFAVTTANAPAVAEICYRLDGIPLALELAAARMKVMSAEKIASRLDRRFRLLTGGRRTAQRRQQTLEAAIDWGHDLLEEHDRAVFRRLSVFYGGWTLEAAELVCCGEDIEDWEVLDHLTSLVDKSLIAVDQGEEPRQRLLETIRAYGRHRLDEAGELEEADERHARHYLEMAVSAESELTGPDQAKWLRRLDEEHDNIRAALKWSREPDRIEDGLLAAGALWRYWYMRGRYGEGRDLIEELLEVAGPKERCVARAKALHGAGTLVIYQGDYERARELLDRASLAWSELEDPVGTVKSLNNLASIAYLQGNYSEARARYEESLEAIRQTDDLQSTADALNNLGLVAAELGDCVDASSFLKESLEIRRTLGDAAETAVTEYNLGTVRLTIGEYDSAEKLFERSLATQRALENRLGVALTLRNLGQVAHHRQDLILARDRYLESLSLSRDLDNLAEISESLKYLGLLSLDETDLDTAQARFEEALAIQERIDHRRGMSDSLNGLGLISTIRGNLEEARSRLRKSLILRREMGHQFMIVESLETFVRLFVHFDEPERALILAGAANALRNSSQTPRPPNRINEFEDCLARAQRAVGEEQAGITLSLGEGLELSEAIRTALGE